jgi:flagellin
MSTINTNVTSLIAQRVLGQNNKALNTSLERLSTGLKINSGADDPAGLIAAQNIKSEQTGITAAINNANRATNIIGTAEGGLSEVSNLLTQLQSLTSQAANSGGLSSAEVNADQLQVDSILSTINRIAQSTSFQGKQLLNGNYAYTTSGVNSTSFQNVQINAASIPEGSTVNVVVQVVTSAQTGEITYAGGALTTNVTLEIAGNTGTQQLSFTSGTAVSAIAASINASKASTGVSATVDAGTGNLNVDSTGFGSDQFVSVKTIAGDFNTSASKDTGRDAVVTINGGAAQAEGTNVSYRAGNLDLGFTLNSAFNHAGTDSFVITGGGATFALGSKVTEANNASIGIQSVSTGSLGDNTDGFLSDLASGGTASLTSGNLVTAQKIIDDATTQVSQLRGRLGAFQTFTLGSTINALGVAFENSSSALSNIEDTDFASETANLTRSQILSSAATTVLAQANAAPQAALQLLQH